ncbi:hypothetical protein Tco_1101709 [Tanacetum coccineum]
MEMMNVTFDELSAMAFEQRNSKLELQGRTSRHIYATRIAPAAPATLNRQTPNASTTTAETAPTPTNSSTEAPAIPNTSQDVDELQQQHFQQKLEQSQLLSEAIADNANNAVFNDNMFINPFATPSTSSAESSSQYVDPTMEPRNVKEAMTNPGWIKSMQDELHQFKQLDV